MLLLLLLLPFYTVLQKYRLYFCEQSRKVTCATLTFGYTCASVLYSVHLHCTYSCTVPILVLYLLLYCTYSCTVHL